MCEVYDKWPELARKAFFQPTEKIDFKDINEIIFSGMGGSGSIGDGFSSIFSKTNLNVSTIKGFHLPESINPKTLVIPISVSGNTIETHTVLKQAKKRGCKIIAFSSGGKIEKFCNNNKIEYRQIPIVHSPRASFVSFFYSILNTLEPMIPLKQNIILKSINDLEQLSKNIASHKLDKKNKSLELAKWINNIPIIYYPNGFKAAAIRFKNSLQENAKLHAMSEDIIEMSHNGIVSWEKTSSIQPILLEGKDDYIKTKKLQKIVKEYFKKNHIQYNVISSPTGSILTKLVYLIYLLDYSSIYKAIIEKIDPSPVKSIEFLKKKIN
ncbi:transcriptional regulator, RpiR family [Nitrosopumilus maritimus SCM1]|uniref:Transcriptional regulator, RpiR family n=2 Tax=Nitrosopumilus maritimus TaxID=338192 RepID=A9A1U2_NITMS|nr:transcriptional regulator, RpiR family [Nitrosopumilus maritimus SCM1]